MLIALVLTGVLCAAGALGADGAGASWPRFHGIKGDNISTETGLLREWPDAGPKLLWTAKGLGHSFGSVTIADGMIYTAGDIDKANVVTAMDTNGAVKWRTENGACWKRSTPGDRGTPAIDRGRVYHENAHGAIVCLDAKTGNKIWGVDVAKKFGGRSNKAWGYSESLVLDGDRVICGPGGDTAMAALDAKTGKTVWKSPSAGEAASYATPIVVEHQGLRMVLNMSQKSLIGVNADTGDLLWKFEHRDKRYVANCVTPIFHDGRVFISHGYRKGSALLKVNVKGKLASVEPVWVSKDLDNRHGGVVLLDGYLYGASHWGIKGKWLCVEWATGKTMYADKGVGEGSVVAADGMLYILSERRKVALVKPAPTGHDIVSQFTLPAGGKGATWAHPVVCGGRLYIRHGDRLYAYDVRAN